MSSKILIVIYHVSFSPFQNFIEKFQLIVDMYRPIEMINILASQASL